MATGAKVNEQVGNVRDDVESQVGHEHFGFDDGVSQPGVRGRASGADDDFITDRYVDRSQFPAAALYGYPGQDLVWPGEFVIGYPQTGPDPLIPGPVLEPSPWWMRNGSYLVYRRLLQDVGLFWRTMRDEAERLATLPGFDKMDEKRLRPGWSDVGRAERPSFGCPRATTKIWARRSSPTTTSASIPTRSPEAHRRQGPVSAGRGGSGRTDVPACRTHPQGEHARCALGYGRTQLHL